MYQYTTTNIINSEYLKDYEGNDLLDSAAAQIPAFAGTAAGLSLPKIGNFKVANIVSIYKRPYTAAVKEIAQITMPTITATYVIRLDVVIKLEQSTNSEYTNYSLDFQKPITVEVIATGTAATDAQAIINQLNGLKNRFGYKYFTAALSTADIVLTCNQAEQHIKSMVISYINPSTLYTNNSIIQPEYTIPAANTTNFAVTTAGKIGFGDDNWMIRKVMLPTAENVRYFGISKNERPVLGGQYTEYVLRYSLTKDGTDGIVSGATSVTTHVFYVKSDLVGLFELAIYPTGKDIVNVATDQAFTLTATDDTTAAVKIDISAIVPFITSTSEITATSSVPAKGTIGAITIATPTGSPLAQTAQIVITKVQAGATTISVTIDGITKTKAITIG